MSNVTVRVLLMKHVIPGGTCCRQRSSVLKFRGASCLGARTHQIRTSTQILDSRYSSYSLLILLLFAIRCLLFSSICSLLSGFRSPSAVRFFAFRFFALRFSLFAFRFFAFRFSLFISCWGNSQRCTSRNCRFRRRFRYIHDVLTGGDLRVRPATPGVLTPRFCRRFSDPRRFLACALYSLFSPRNLPPCIFRDTIHSPRS
jgi:hypothetical protein